MLEYAEPVTKLIDELKRLPSIGHKSAQRLAFHIMRIPDADLETTDRRDARGETDALFFVRSATISRKSIRAGFVRHPVAIIP